MTSAPGDDDPLALAAGQLVRDSGRRSRAGQAGRLERRAHARLALGAAVADAVDLERLGDEVVDGLLRVERLVRVLEDELDAAPVARAAPWSPTACETSAPSKVILPGGLAGELDDDPAGRRLARARLADQAEDLAALRCAGRCRRRRGRRRAAGAASASMSPPRIGKWTSQALEPDELGHGRHTGSGRRTAAAAAPGDRAGHAAPPASADRSARSAPGRAATSAALMRTAAVLARRVEVAGDADAVREDDLGRDDLAADGHGHGTARVEPAAGGRVAQVGRRPGDGLEARAGRPGCSGTPRAASACTGGAAP